MTDPAIFDWLRDQKARGLTPSQALLKWVLSTDELQARREAVLSGGGKDDRGGLPAETAPMLELLQEIIDIWSEEDEPFGSRRLGQMLSEVQV